MTDKPDPPAEASPDLLAEALASLRNLIHSVGKRSERKDTLSEPTQPEDPTSTGHVATAKPSVAGTDAATPRAPGQAWHGTTTEEDDIPTLHRVVYRPGETQTTPTQSLAADQALISDQAVQRAGADIALGEYPEESKGPPTDPQLETPSTSHTPGTDQVVEPVGPSTSHTQAETAGPDSADSAIARSTAEGVAGVTLSEETPQTAAGEDAVASPAGAIETHPRSVQTVADPTGVAETHLQSLQHDILEVDPPEPDPASTEGITDDSDPKLETTLTEADEDVVLTRYTSEYALMEPHESTEPTAAAENATSAGPFSGMTAQAMAAHAVDLIDAKLHDRVDHNLHPDLAEELRQMLQEMLDDWTSSQ